MNTPRLQKVIMLSRHNLRSPIFGMGSELSQLTPHRWCDWQAPAGELTPKGARLETRLGAFFREYFLSRGLPLSSAPTDRSRFRVYANSLQRAVATGEAFIHSMMPDADIPVEHHYPLGSRDPVFSMFFPSSIERHADTIRKQMIERYRHYDLLAPIRAVEQALDHAASNHALITGAKHFSIDDLVIRLLPGQQPGIEGGMKLAVVAMDALILQYYESSQSEPIVFGRPITPDALSLIGRLYGMYQNLLFAIPETALLVSRPLLEALIPEMNSSERVFSGFFGHDCNITGVLTAMRAIIPEMPDTLTPDTPIGCKLIFEFYDDPVSGDVIEVRLVYQSTAQLIEQIPTSPLSPPIDIPIDFAGLEKIAPGRYRRADLIARMQGALDAGNALAAEQ